MGQDFDGFRGRGRGRGRGDGGGGGSRGFRGGGRGGSPGGFRGGFRGGSDRGGGFRGGFRSERGGFGGDRGNFRGGFRGGDRGNFRGGDRGNFRGGDRGGFRGGDRGNARGGFRGGRGGQGGKPMDKNVPTSHQYQEVRDGLQLFVVYKTAPTLEETKQQLPGFHSRTSRPIGNNPSTLAHMLLFTDVESLEAAKIKLEADESVESVDYMGMRSAKKQADVKETRQLYLRFEEPREEGEVKDLDDKMISATAIKDNKRLYMAEYPSTAEAREAVKVLKEKIGKEGKLEAVRESFGMNYQVEAQQGINRGIVVFRDVLKTARIKDFAAVFPDAISFQLFRNTFHESKYCHAAIGFDHLNKANDVLDAGPREFLGKKIFPFPAHVSLMQDVAKLGKQKSEEVVAAAKLLKEASSGPPNKKVKLENDDDDDEEEGDEEEDDDEDEEGEGEEDDDEDEEGGEDAEEGDDDDDEDESD